MRTYLIKRGEHRASGLHLPKFRPGRTGMLRFRVRFSIACALAVPGVDRYDFNKAPGLAAGDHMLESVRLGWRGTGTHIEVAGFFHVDGSFIPDLRGEKLLGAVKPNEWLEVVCSVRPGSMFISALGKSLRVERGEKRSPWPVVYVPNPYFGGNATPDADCKVEVEFLEFGR